MIIYTTKDGDMLDHICWKHYGTESAVPEVLEANPGLVDLGAVLEAGVEIILPEIATPEPDQGTSLWD
ncbi:tail protein X [Maridesulfovibrio salexigens]|uniref:Tail X family protein n=1 Tax=Maridesulfovibrio salexigens (strain ATCC 14822 / DSM 2638 / NCIMB 8403 / VKM B-1763) TaxID=526222 RepID=C6BVW9_MARSD|nr:tail protein X [Maridesulfovibrio salexigens]ACS80172.1 tail X family protein [Maridesulfovibrio salexigens DSM 2638]